VADQTIAQKIDDGVDGIDEQEAQDRIRLAAYGIWEEEGKPDGRADDHWQEAERRTRSGNDYMRRDDSSGASSGESSAAGSGESQSQTKPDPASAPKGVQDGRPTTGADSTARPPQRATGEGAR